MRPKTKKTAQLGMEELSARITPAVASHGFVLVGSDFVYQITLDTVNTPSGGFTNRVDLDTETNSGSGSSGIRARETLSGFSVLIQDTDISAIAFNSGGTPRTFLGVRVTGSSAADEVDGSGLVANPNYKLIANGGEGNDRLVGGAFADTLNGQAGNDTIIGNDGNDTLTGETGDDDITGGAGNDTISGNEGNDTLNGNDGDDAMTGGSGNDLMNGGNGNDDMDGGDGNDTLNGDAGDDRLIGGNGADILTGGAGKDEMHGDDAPGSVNPAGDGDDTVNADTADFVGGANITGGGQTTETPTNTRDDILNITSSAGDNITYTNSGFEEINGGAGNERITNDPNISETFRGNAGNDTFVAVAPVSTGNNGNDRFEGGGNDAVNPVTGAGGDTLDYSNAPADVLLILNNGVPIVGGDASGDSGTGIENLIGGAGNDILHGDAGNNIIQGNAGNDTIIGNAGDDRILGGAGNDDLNGGAGNDRMSGGAGNDDMVGGRGDDVMYGDAGNDIIEGGRDNDTLNGGTGDDILDGGLGIDTFILDASAAGTGALLNQINADLKNPNDQYWGGEASDRFVVYNAWDPITIGMTTLQVLNTGRVNETIAYITGQSGDNKSDFTTAKDTISFTLDPLPVV
jgi:Ca2+-binding RTX toxin-like protein